jgi:cell wall-associated NlpC family hydrolase
VQHLAPTGVRRYERPRGITLVALGVVVSGSVAMASPASAASATQNAFVAAAVQPSRPVTITQMPTLNTFVNTRTVASLERLANQVSALRVTTVTIRSDRASVRSGRAVRLAGTMTDGADHLPASPHVLDLQVKSGDTWKSVASRATSLDGYVVFTVTPTKSSTYRLSYPGAPALDASVSAATTVTVTSPPRSTVSSPRSSSSATASAGYSVVSAATGRGAQVVAAAAAQTGKPYLYGAAGPNAFDCSGLTQFAFKKVGISLPHSADAQKNYGMAVSRSAAQPGDLVIFLSGGYAYHAAIYAGGGYMYDAPNSGSTVGRHAIYSGTVIFRRLV